MTPLPPPLSPKEMKVFSFIEAYVEKKGYPPTYQEMQEKFDYKSLSSIQQFVTQLVDKGYLDAPLGKNQKRALTLVSPEDSELVSIPLEGRVAAGRLTEAIQTHDSVEIPKSLLKKNAEYFALTVKGDSMIEDCILDGDLVVIRRSSDAKNGDTVVALVDSDATIKRYYKKKDEIELHPANPNYDVIRVKPGSEFKILGVLASVIRQCD